MSHDDAVFPLELVRLLNPEEPSVCQQALERLRIRRPTPGSANFCPGGWDLCTLQGGCERNDQTTGTSSAGSSALGRRRVRLCALSGAALPRSARGARSHLAHGECRQGLHPSCRTHGNVWCLLGAEPAIVVRGCPANCAASRPSGTHLSGCTVQYREQTRQASGAPVTTVNTTSMGATSGVRRRAR